MFCEIASLSGWGYQRQLRAFLGKTCINRTNKRSGLRVDGGAGAACHAGSQAQKLSSCQALRLKAKLSSAQAGKLKLWELRLPCWLCPHWAAGETSNPLSLPPSTFFPPFPSSLPPLSSSSSFPLSSSFTPSFSFSPSQTFSSLFLFPFYSSLPPSLFLLISPRSVMFLAMFKESSWAFTITMHNALSIS